MSIATVLNIYIELPASNDFNAAKLVMDERIKGVES